MKKLFTASAISLSSLVPLLVSAQSASGKIAELGTNIKAINTTVVAATATLFMALAMVAFFFGMAKFILASRSGETKELENGRQFMLWSVIGLFVMFSIYGLILFFQGVIGIEGKTNIKIPSFEIGGATSRTVDPLGGNTQGQIPGGSGGNTQGQIPGGNGGSCIPNSVCYTCGMGVCICDGSSQCVFDYANPGTTPYLRTSCTQSGGNWGVDEGCICPSGKDLDLPTGQCILNTDSSSGLQLACTQSGGSYSDGCICPADKPIDNNTGRCTTAWSPTAGE